MNHDPEHFALRRGLAKFLDRSVAGACVPAVFRKKPALACCAFACGFIPAIASANPVNPGGEIRGVLGIGLTGFALGFEVALTAVLLALVCRIERRWQLAAGLLALNLVSYFTFVAFLYPKLQNLFAIEVMIWLLEAAGMAFLVRRLAGNPLLWWQALAISFVGNLASYLVGEAVWNIRDPSFLD